MTLKRVRTAVLISGRGSNMAALIDAASNPSFPAEISLVISNRRGAPGLGIAEAKGVKSVAVDNGNFEAEAAEILQAEHIELICLAGFMKILPASFVNKWKDRILNIHPSLLPAFPGLNTHQRALEAGVAEHGATVHRVTAELDAGPILIQGHVPVLPGDDAASLGARVLRIEHQIYPWALAALATAKNLP